MARRRRGLLIAGIAAAIVVLLGALVFRGVLWPNRIFAASYDVRGVDVARYQGTIDWETLADQDVQFAYIKATEGSSHVDERFAENWRSANRTRLLVGAYHFMSFESPGETQAANFVAKVPAEPGTLPPVVDLEHYGKYADDPPSTKQVREILSPLLAGLEKHYGVPATIYTTKDAYDAYVRGAYPDNPIWIRSVFLPPRLGDDRDWTIWQYSHRDRMPGYSGVERYIDVNVFRGSLAELRATTLSAGSPSVQP